MNPNDEERLRSLLSSLKKLEDQPGKLMRHDGCGLYVFYLKPIDRYCCMCLVMGTARILYETEKHIWVAIDLKEPDEN